MRTRRYTHLQSPQLLVVLEFDRHEVQVSPACSVPVAFGASREDDGAVGGRRGTVQVILAARALLCRVGERTPRDRMQDSSERATEKRADQYTVRSLLHSNAVASLFVVNETLTTTTHQTNNALGGLWILSTATFAGYCKARRVDIHTAAVES